LNGHLFRPSIPRVAVPIPFPHIYTLSFPFLSILSLPPPFDPFDIVGQWFAFPVPFWLRSRRRRSLPRRTWPSLPLSTCFTSFGAFFLCRPLSAGGRRALRQDPPFERLPAPQSLFSVAPHSLSTALLRALPAPHRSLSRRSSFFFPGRTVGFFSTRRSSHRRPWTPLFCRVSNGAFDPATFFTCSAFLGSCLRTTHSFNSALGHSRDLVVPVPVWPLTVSNTFYP